MSATIENASPVVGDENDDPQTEVTTVKAACKKAEQHESKSEKVKVLQQATRDKIDSKLETPAKELDNSGTKANPMIETSRENATDGTLDSTGGNHSAAAADLRRQGKPLLKGLSKSVLKMFRNSVNELEKAFELVDLNCDEPSKKMEENTTGGTLDSTGGNNIADDVLIHVQRQIKSVAEMLDINIEDLQLQEAEKVAAATWSETQKALNNIEELSARLANELVAKHALTAESLIEELARVAKVSAEGKQLAEEIKFEYGIDEVTDDHIEEEDFRRSESKAQ